MDTDGHGNGEMWKLVLTAFKNHPCISESIRGSKKNLPQILELSPDGVVIYYVNDFIF
jgi:hypothetical protein